MTGSLVCSNQFQGATSGSFWACVSSQLPFKKIYIIVSKASSMEPVMQHDKGSTQQKSIPYSQVFTVQVLEKRFKRSEIQQRYRCSRVRDITTYE